MPESGVVLVSASAWTTSPGAEKGKMEKIVAAYDVGTPVNIQSVEGQIEGGMVMGLGYALTEEFKCQEGYCKTKLGTLGLMRSTDVPKLNPLVGVSS